MEYGIEPYGSVESSLMDTSPPSGVSSFALMQGEFDGIMYYSEQSNRC